MKPYNKRTKLGIASLHYNEDGKPTNATFAPSVFTLDAPAMETLLAFPARSSDDVMTKAQTVVSAWFLAMADIEVADREFNRVETELVNCEKWPNGVPKLCEVEFYFATTTKE